MVWNTYVNESTRIIKFAITDIKSDIVVSQAGCLFHGKWLDVYFEDLRKAGTYPILSVAGAGAANNTTGPGPTHIEVAARSIPSQRHLDHAPPVAHTPLLIRVGGTVLWTPTGLTAESTHNIVFVADGLGARSVSSISVG
jgi:hypothetical protein